MKIMVIFMPTFYEIALWFITFYIISMLILGVFFGRKYLFKSTKKAEKIEKIQNNAFQLVGFVLVSITVLMVQPASTKLFESISIFSLGFLLLIISIIITEIRTVNFIAYISEKLNYGSLFCFSLGFLTYFINLNILNLDVIVIYLLASLFVLYFIIMDVSYYTKFFEEIKNVRRKK